MDKIYFDKSNKAIVVMVIKEELLKVKKDLTEDELNLLVENIYEIAFLYIKNVPMEDIEKYITLKKIILSYNDDFKPKSLKINLDLNLLYDTISKAIYKIQELMTP